MTGITCPSCGRSTDWGSTTNEWAYICTPCDARWNRAGERMPPLETIRQLFPHTTVIRQGIDSPSIDAHNAVALPEPVAPTAPVPAPARNGV